MGTWGEKTELKCMLILHFKLFVQAFQSACALGLCALCARTDLQGDVPAAGFKQPCVLRVNVGLFPTNGSSCVSGNFPNGDLHQGVRSLLQQLVSEVLLTLVIF